MRLCFVQVLNGNLVETNKVVQLINNTDEVEE